MVAERRLEHGLVIVHRAQRLGQVERYAQILGLALFGEAFEQRWFGKLAVKLVAVERRREKVIFEPSEIVRVGREPLVRRKQVGWRTQVDEHAQIAVIGTLKRRSEIVAQHKLALQGHEFPFA